MDEGMNFAILQKLTEAAIDISNATHSTQTQNPLLIQSVRTTHPRRTHRHTLEFLLYQLYGTIIQINSANDIFCTKALWPERILCTQGYFSFLTSFSPFSLHTLCSLVVPLETMYINRT